jgi:5'-nucleotidase
MKIQLRNPVASLITFVTISCAIVACGGNDDGASLHVSGVAATGAPLAGASVKMNCADGISGTGTTDASGYFRIGVNGSLPCMVEVVKDNVNLHSIAAGSGSNVTAHVTPLTEAIVSQITSDPVTYFAGFNAAAASKLTGSVLINAQKAVTDNLIANGVSVPSSVTDLLGGALIASTNGAGNDYDKLLDSIGNKTYQVKIIAMNDFHGNIQAPAASNGGQVTLPDGGAGVKVNVGGAAYVATAIKTLKKSAANSVVVGAGDLTGASPFESSITHDEASVDILNQMGMEVTSVGNHEFDYGKSELLRKQNGGCYPASGDLGKVGVDTCFMDAATGTYSATGNTFTGAKYKYLAANVVDKTTSKTLFPATYTKRFGPVSVGFIGLTLKGTTQLVSSGGIADLTFNDEIQTINNAAKSLKAAGVQAVVVLIHQGGVSTALAVNDKTCPVSFGDLGTIMDGIGTEVDVVVSGHSHQEYVCDYTGAASKKKYLVTQTGFYGGAVTDINLTVDPKKGVISRDANTVPVIQADKNTSVTIPQSFQSFAKDTAVDALVTNYVAVSKALAAKQVGTIGANLMRALFTGTTNRDESAEGAMGGVMADAYLYGTPGGADFAVVNPGGVRSDLTCAAGVAAPCPVSYSQINTVAPFANTLTKVNITGAQVIRLLEQQWEAPNCTAKYNPATFQYGRLLQVSNTLTYSFDNSVNAWTSGNIPTNCAAAGTGNRVIVSSVKINGASLDLNKTYTIVTNNFLGLGSGGDNFTVLAKLGTQATDTKVLDLDAMIAYFRDKSPVAVPAPRVTRVN